MVHFLCFFSQIKKLFCTAQGNGGNYNSQCLNVSRKEQQILTFKKNRWKELAPLLSNQTNRKKCVKRIFFLDYFQFLYAILSDMVKYFRSSVNPLTLRLKSNFPPDIYLVPIQLVIQVNYKIKWSGAFIFGTLHYLVIF